MSSWLTFFILVNLIRFCCFARVQNSKAKKDVKIFRQQSREKLNKSDDEDDSPSSDPSASVSNSLTLNATPTAPGDVGMTRRRNPYVSKNIVTYGQKIIGSEDDEPSLEEQGSVSPSRRRRARKISKKSFEQQKIGEEESDDEESNSDEDEKDQGVANSSAGSTVKTPMLSSRGKRSRKKKIKSFEPQLMHVEGEGDIATGDDETVVASSSGHASTLSAKNRKRTKIKKKSFQPRQMPQRPST